MGLVKDAFCYDVAGSRMSDKKKGFYLFCAVVVIAVGVCIYGVITLNTTEEETKPDPIPEPIGKVDVGEVAPATQILKRQLETPDFHADETSLYHESIEDGAVPTQEIGEKGSLEGAIFTKNALQYPETQYERLENSPLIKFTDEMIWKNGSDNAYKVKRDAMRDQAKTIQEASIALSVSPRVEMGKVLGYRLVEIPSDTLFSKLGMVSGDIVLSINGRMPDMEPMALMFVNMVAGKQGASTIEVEHRGVKRTITISAAD